MPAAETEYVPDPGDLLPARVVGEWSHEKHHFLGRYMTIFATAMRKQWKHLVYVDLFAGPGVCNTRGTTEFFNGSPLMALERAFTQHIYVDMDPIATQTLERRVDRFRAQRRIDVITGDCNAVIDRVVDLIPTEQCLTFAFIDPTNWEIHFETVRRLVQGRKVDVLFTFHAGNMQRVAHLDEQPKMDAFFGSEEWPRVKAGVVPTIADFVNYYRMRMVSLGYLDRETARDVIMKNSKNRTMYLMPFYSKHALGFTFFDAVAQEDYDGQLSLFRPPPVTPKQT